MTLKVGLTGGVASGKSTVADYFTQLSVPVIDADKIAHELLEPGEAGYIAITEKFGGRFLDEHGRIDRRRLRHWIFDQSSNRTWLEAQLHPLIRRRMSRQAEAVITDYCIMVIPLLAESEAARALVDRILVIDAPESVQVERLCKRDGHSAEQARRILQAQIDRRERLAFADDVINNVNGLEAVKARVDKLHQFYLQLAHKPSSS